MHTQYRHYYYHFTKICVLCSFNSACPQLRCPFINALKNMFGLFSGRKHTDLKQDFSFYATKTKQDRPVTENPGMYKCVELIRYVNPYRVSMEELLKMNF